MSGQFRTLAMFSSSGDGDSDNEFAAADDDDIGVNVMKLLFSSKIDTICEFKTSHIKRTIKQFKLCHVVAVGSL